MMNKESIHKSECSCGHEIHKTHGYCDTCNDCHSEHSHDHTVKGGGVAHAHGGHVHIHYPEPSGEKVIEIEGLSVYYKNTAAIENITLDVHRGEFLAIIGPNGGGKTTLLKAILGLCDKYTGTVRVFGSEKERGTIGYVPQFSLVDRKFPISVLEAVMTASVGKGLHPFGYFKKADRERAMGFLSRVGISELAKRQISELSGGEFQRLLIARALAVSPKILILDEPTASVDPASRASIYELLSSLNREGMTVILVTHDLMAVSSSVGRIACLNKRLAYHGEPRLTEEVCNEMYGCPIDLIAHEIPHRVLGGHTHTGGECND